MTFYQAKFDSINFQFTAFGKTEAKAIAAGKKSLAELEHVDKTYTGWKVVK